jgi:hypothetical protein
MKLYYRLVTFCLLAVLATTAITQDNKSKLREIGIEIGIRQNNLYEQRLSNNWKRSYQPVYAVFNNKQTDNRRQLFRMEFSQGVSNRSDQFISFKNLQANVHYSYLWKIKNEWIGPSYSSETLLIWPSNTDKFGNNPITYTIAQNLGFTIDRTYNLKSTDDWSFDINRTIQSSLLSYNIRPAYGHPYPEEYLQEGVFTPTRRGMGKAIAKSGKLQTINKKLHLNLVLGLNLTYRDALKMGLNYRYNYSATLSNQSVKNSSHDLSFALSYIY